MIMIVNRFFSGEHLDEVMVILYDLQMSVDVYQTDNKMSRQSIHAYLQRFYKIFSQNVQEPKTNFLLLTTLDTSATLLNYVSNTGIL